MNLPPVFEGPHTTINAPVQMLVCPDLAEGAPEISSWLHLLVEGLYRPPVLTGGPEVSTPPQTNTSEPVQMAV
jgi:hypothetical protein